MDWSSWARQAEAALDVASRGDWRALFAPGATFADPATMTPTSDLGDISRHTRRVFPNWTQEITSIRGGNSWAVFEWVGRANFSSPGRPGDGASIEMHGATIVEVNDEGLVTTWRDYLDRKEPEEQIKAAVKASRS